MRALALVLAVFFATQVFADIEIQKLNQQLQTEKIEWVAGESAISQLSAKQFKQMLGGASEEFPLLRDEEELTASIASSLDWRSKGGSNWVGAVKHQGQCGSCVAFAAIATMETQYRIAAGRPSLNIRLSPQHLFSCGGGSCTWGWDGDSASRFLKNSGVPDEACFPYESGRTEQTGSCSRTCRDHRRRSVRLLSYSKPTTGRVNINQIRQALQHGPVAAVMNIYDDFRYYRSGIYRHVRGGYQGGHVVSIIGYNDSSRYFIVRNSWGTGWGERGFVKVSYDDTSGLGSHTWSYRPDVSGAIFY